MMDERKEELAALHVLGALSDAEAREFKKDLHADPELQAYVARLSAATGALAGAIPLVEPPPQLRAKILAAVAEPQKVISLPQRQSGLLNWLPWAFATCLAVLGMVLFAQDSRLTKQVLAQQQQVSSQQEQIAAQQKQVSIQQEKLGSQQEQIRAQAQQISSLNELAATLQSATNHLQQTVFALQEENRLASLKIAMLNSLVADAPKAIAVSLWDNQRQDGVFVAQNLKSLAADRDYELWIIDGQTPVAAGVFHADKDGNIRLDFKPSQAIKSAGQFAVTEEVKGGVTSPTLKNMVLASN